MRKSSRTGTEGAKTSGTKPADQQSKPAAAKNVKTKDAIPDDRSTADVAGTISDAIQRRALLEFSYHGRRRVVAPYCFGVSTRGLDALRAIEIGAASASNGTVSGKLWTVSKMTNPRALEETFTPDDPNYNPNDSAMTRIYCRV